MKYTLYPPGTRKNSQYWTFRGSVEGRQIEASCRTTDQAEAERFADHYVANVKAARNRLFPKKRHLGDFEQWLLANYYWHDGLVLNRNSGVLRFHQAAHGYRSAKVVYDGELKTVLEHRVVFLLVNGWLPDSIDHKDRVRSHNDPSNLEASTPYRQAQNRGHGLKSRSVPQLLQQVRHRTRRGENRGMERIDE